MKTIGLIGGMSWESTASYYQILNRGVKKQLGGLHSAKIVLNSLDFDEIEKLQMSGDWQQLAIILSNAAISLERAGADFMLICTNTMHKVANQVQSAVSIPLLHIADATGLALKAQGINKVGLLGTRFTMEQDFYKGYLEKIHGIQVLIPNLEDRNKVHDVIYQELCKGLINPHSNKTYLSIINNLAKKGAQGIILGCTEIGLLVKQQDTKIKLFDTTQIHAESAINKALS